MIQAPPQPVTPLSYSTPAVSGASRTWAAFALAFVGLVLIFLGGCFTIGIMIQLHPALSFGAPGLPVAWSDGDYILHAVLYLSSFACFASGTLLVFRGVAGLSRILWNA